MAKREMIRGCGTLPGLRRGGPSSRFREAAPRLPGTQRGERQSPCMSNVAGPDVRGGRCGPPRRSREALRPDPTHRWRPLSASLCATFRVARLRRCPNPVPLARWKPVLQPAAIGARDASLFSAYFLEAPGSGRTSRTVIRGAASLALSPHAARGYAHSCRHSPPHPNCLTRLSADRARPRSPCVTHRGTC